MVCNCDDTEQLQGFLWEIYRQSPQPAVCKNKR